MSKIFVGPAGRVIKGHVLDCAVGPLTRAMRDYDAQLYVKWNPKKLKGHGCWEVRRTPEFMVPKEIYTYDGNTYVHLAFVEQNMVHHVADVPFLNYQILDLLHERDQWKDDSRGRDFNARAEYAEAKFLEREEDKAEAEKAYAIKQIRRETRDLREFVLSGGNPYRLADHWKNGS